MKVYVVITGMYENEDIAGVYASVEAAQAAYPIPDPLPELARPRMVPFHNDPGWRQDDEGRWTNGLDWDWNVNILPFEVQGEINP